MVEIKIECNLMRCGNDVEEHFYCDKHFEQLLEEAREEGREEIRKQHE